MKISIVDLFIFVEWVVLVKLHMPKAFTITMLLGETLMVLLGHIYLRNARKEMFGREFY